MFYPNIALRHHCFESWHCAITMGFGTTVYNLLFRRTSTFTLTIIVGAVFFERAFDHSADALWDRMNQGVSVAFYLMHT